MKLKILLVTLFLLHIFFRFYHLEQWANLGWDQIDNAWAAVRILVANKFPLLGMVAKANSGIYIGPLYYYIGALFYAITGLDPVASPILAGVTSVFGFWVLYVVTLRLFNQRVALVASAINTFSSFIIFSDRVQWPVNFIAPISLLIFYCLHKITTGHPKYFLPLGALVGFSFHIHFTAVFYPVIVLLSLPFIPKKRNALKYIGLSLVIFILFFIPQAIFYLTTRDSTLISNYGNYLTTYYHGFHLRRLLQIVHDAFIDFEAIMGTPYRVLRPFVFFWIPLFFLALRKRTFSLFYLIGLWILVPWILFSTYRGEISNYYFSMQRYIAVFIFAYLTIWVWDRKSIIFRAALGIFWIYWAAVNVQLFLGTQDGNLVKERQYARESVEVSRRIEFTEGNLTSYLYFYYYRTLKGSSPYQL